MKTKGIHPDEVLFNSLLDGCSKNGKIDLAFQIFRQMQTELIPASTITFNSLIDACIRSENDARAWELLDQMERSNIQPDNFTYSTLFKGIRSEKQSKELDKAFELLQNLKSSLNAHSNFRPDEILYNVLLDACINCKQLDRAISLFNEMRAPTSLIHPDEISYNTIIKGCSQYRNVSKAFEVFHHMKQSRLHPNDVTYNSLIDVCVRSGDMQRAWFLLSEMQENGIHPDNFTYSTLIKGIRAGGPPSDLERAFTLLEQMKRKNFVKPDEILYNCLIDACVRFNDIHRAVAVFSEM